MGAAANGEAQTAKAVPSAIRNSPFASPADKAKKTAQEFETMFLEQTLERVFASSGTEGPARRQRHRRRGLPLDAGQGIRRRHREGRRRRHREPDLPRALEAARGPPCQKCLTSPA